MPIFEGQFVSIVLIGRQNPQILNHNFLRTYKILPENEEPFKSLFAKKESEQFTEFVSTPVLTAIKYGPIALVVEQNRYQITDSRFDNPSSSPIIKITKNYFGEHLKYTPITLGGINLNGNIKFDDPKDERTLDEKIGITFGTLESITEAADIQIGITFFFPWHKGIIEVRLPRTKDSSQPRKINFNYEFMYQDIDSFLKNLDDIDQVYKKFIDLLQRLEIGGLQ
jgi:hypothetical protein